MSSREHFANHTASALEAAIYSQFCIGLDSALPIVLYISFKTRMVSKSLSIEKILGEKPRNAEFTFDGYKAVVTFANSADEWPRQWILKRVEFKNANGENKSASFNRSPASVTEGEQPIVLEF